jgi:hypothetical protein
MRKLFPVLLLLAFALACSNHDASVQNSDQQKDWPRSDQSAESKKSTNTEVSPSTPASKSTDQNDNHTDNLTTTPQHTPNPKATPGETGQGNNKDPRTSGTTSGTPKK